MTILIEIVGEPSVGKTHMALGFPEPFLIDCGPRGEGEVVIKKFYDDIDSRYVVARTWKDVVEGVNLAIRGKKKTIIFDLSEYLVTLAGREWCRVNGKKSIFPIVNYQHVYRMVDDIINLCISNGINVVMISGLKDNYVDDKKTGRREHAGYKKLTYQCDIRILLELVKEGDKWIRRGRVVKNRFVDRCSEEFKEYLPSCDYEGIKEIGRL